jgi:hypothetical protein
LPGQQKNIRVDLKDFLPSIKKYNEDRLYGARISIAGYQLGSSHLLLDDKVFVYRFVDAVDSDHADRILEFADTAADGNAAGSVTRTRKILDFTGPANPTLQLSATPNFRVDNSTKTITFDPTEIESDLSADISLITPEGSAVLGPGQLSVKADGVVQNWFVNRIAFESELARIFKAGTIATPIENSFLASPAQRVALVNAAIDHAVALLERGQPYAPGLDLVSVPDKNTIIFSDFSTPPGTLPGDLGKSSTLDNGYDITGAKPLTGVALLVHDRTNYSRSEQNFRLSEYLNESPSGEVFIYLENYFGHSYFTTVDEAANALGHTIAHELGHAVGLFHTSAMDGTGNPAHILGIPGAATDVMAQGLDTSGSRKISVTSPALRVALGATWDQKQAQTAIDYYGAWVNRPDPGGWGNAVVGATADATAGRTDGNRAFGPEYTDPVLWVMDKAEQGLVDDIDFGTVSADGVGSATAVRELELLNIGLQPAVLKGIGSSSRQLSVIGPPAGTVLAPGAHLPLTLVFDPISGGQESGVVTVDSNSLNGGYQILFSGRGQSPNGQVVVTVPNNNVGGQDVGLGAKQVHGVATLRNDGLQPLEISSLTLDDTSAGFSLIDLPPGFDAANPIVLASGESIDLGIAFDPSRLGIARTTLHILCNDPVTPLFSCSIVGTGTGDLLETLDWGRDYVALEYDDGTAAPPMRTVSDNAGNWSFFLEPGRSVHYAIFDPVSGLIAHGYDMTARFGSALTGGEFNASTAPDSDFDGLPDDIEFAIGTSSAKSDSDRDALSDFAEVDMGLNPLDGRGPAGRSARGDWSAGRGEGSGSGRADGWRERTARLCRHRLLRPGDRRSAQHAEAGRRRAA